MPSAGLERPRRQAALKGATDAMAQLTALQSKWILTADARPFAAIVDPLIAKLLKVTQVLADNDGEHWDMAPVLGYIRSELASMGRFELHGAVGYVTDAYDAIVAQRDDS
jgi:hypothetical protein